MRFAVDIVQHAVSALSVLIVLNGPDQTHLWPPLSCVQGPALGDPASARGLD